jgi:FkbH-like protein
MYETESQQAVESASQIPPEILQRFAALRSSVAARTGISWGEHCTECGWPSCYTTCELYQPRPDLKCRRFADGMVRLECPDSLNGYLLKITFKRWAKLWARSRWEFRDLEQALALERRDYRIGRMVQAELLPAVARRSLSGKRYAWKKRLASRAAAFSKQGVSSFLLECYNPQSVPVSISLQVGALDTDFPYPNLVQILPGFRSQRELRERRPGFQQLISIQPGYSLTRIPQTQIAEFVDASRPFNIELTPNDAEGPITLYFGAMDFAVESRGDRDGGKPVKCVIWDLDNTLWHGTLIEDGAEALKLRDEVSRILEELDRRGILQSIASKNDAEPALETLRRFGVSEFFLCPQISWSPKSGAIRAIAQTLNIGLDSILFVDDSEFELQEVAAAMPEVRTLNAREYKKLLALSSNPVTEESTNRRKMYRIEEQRRSAELGFGDYLQFLRNCNIELAVDVLNDENLERVHELTQRTNQMNFTGSRYGRDALRDLIADETTDSYVLSCSDRFGSYGIIGFAIVDPTGPRLRDLMFSCRVQAKRVEHAFVLFLVQRYCAHGASTFEARFRQTARNSPAEKVFPEIEMEIVLEGEGERLWRATPETLSLRQDIVRITLLEAGRSVGASVRNS